MNLYLLLHSDELVVLLVIDTVQHFIAGKQYCLHHFPLGSDQLGDPAIRGRHRQNLVLGTSVCSASLGESCPYSISTWSRKVCLMVGVSFLRQCTGKRDGRSFPCNHSCNPWLVAAYILGSVFKCWIPLQCCCHALPRAREVLGGRAEEVVVVFESSTGGALRWRGL